MKRVPTGVTGLDYAALVLVALTGVVYWLTLHEGLDWGGGDFASYIWNAENMLAGRALGETPFIPNYAANTGVTVVPPFFPLTLAAPIAIFGSDVELLKLYHIGFVLGFFYLAFRYARADLGGFAILYLLTLAASPQLWAMRGALLSEYLFLLLIMAVVMSWERAYSLDRAPGGTAWAGLAAALAGAAVLTRVVGIVFIPAGFLAGVWAERRLSLKTVLITCVTAAAFAYLVLAVGIFDQYGRSFSRAALEDAGRSEISASRAGDLWSSILTTLQLVPERIRFALGQVSVLWTRGIQGDPVSAGGWPGQYQRAVTGVLFVLGAVGFLARARRRVTLAEWLTLGYGSMMLLVPAYLSSGRMYLPVAVMLLFYAFYAAVFLARRLPVGAGSLPPAALAALVVFSEVLSFQAMGNPPPRYGSADPRAIEFFENVRKTVPDEAVMIGYRPRGVALFTGRTGTDYHEPRANPDFWERVETIGADFMYFDEADPRASRYASAEGGGSSAVEKLAFAFIEGAEPGFDLVFANERFRLYRLRR
jgi:hypothetical protein